MCDRGKQQQQPQKPSHRLQPPHQRRSRPTETHRQSPGCETVAEMLPYVDHRAMSVCRSVINPSEDSGRGRAICPVFTFEILACRKFFVGNFFHKCKIFNFADFGEILGQQLKF